MSKNLPTLYAVHLHQKQANVACKDELFQAENLTEAICKIHEIAEDHGCFEIDLSEIEATEEVDIGSSIVGLLRSSKLDTEVVEGSDLAEDDDWYAFELKKPHAPDLDSRSVRFIRYVRSSDSRKE